MQRYQNHLLILTSLLYIFCGIGCESTQVEPTTNTTQNPKPVDYGALEVIELRCDSQEHPLAIENTKPHLSWQLKPVARSLKQLKQSAYQILVATEPNKLTPELANLWNSQRVESDQTTHILYEGTPLLTHQACFWQVRIWDQSNMESPWSTPAQWRLGLVDPNDWGTAQWITMAEDDFESALETRDFQTEDMNEPIQRRTHTSPLLRHSFPIPKPIKAAIAYVVGLGCHELHVNGQKIGDHVLDPAQTRYNQRAFYVTHDITEHLHQGNNAIGLWLGNGFFGQNVAYNPTLAYGTPRAKAKIWIQYEDGTTGTVVTSPLWRSHYSPILFDNVYAGETYDARQEQIDWASAGFRDGAWKHAQITEAPCQRLVAQYFPPMRRIQEITPTNIRVNPQLGCIVDLGQNISGWLRLTLNEKTDTQITITYGEHLSEDGNQIDTHSTGHHVTGVIQQDIYVCKGQANETWEPRFTYHGFRYAEIQGLTSMPTTETVQGIQVHSDLSPHGSFSCSNEVLTQMVDVSKRTIANSLHGLPETCPHREKVAGIGEAHLWTETAILHYDMNRFLAKYLIDLEDVLGKRTKPITHLPFTEPINTPPMMSPGKRLGPAATADWGAAIVLIPWYHYQAYGDSTILSRIYPHMRIWAQHQWTFVKEGLLQNNRGDLYAPTQGAAVTTVECSPDISGTLVYLECLRILSKVAALEQDNILSVWCKERHGQLQRDFNERHLSQIEGTNAWSYGSQTADAMALRFGIVPDDKVQAVANGLLWNVEVRHQGHHACGIFGLKYLYSALAENSQADLAYKIMTQRRFPSHTHTLGSGATTWPEYQYPTNEAPPHPWGSGNHACHSGFATFFHEIVAGIRLDPENPGYKHIIFKPIPLGKLRWAKAEHKSPHGLIKSSWRIQDQAFNLRIEVPVNCTATVHVPGVQVEAPEGATPVDMRDNHVIFELGSGRYTFVSK